MANNVFELRSDGYWHAPPKDPADTLDYPIDLSGVMEGDGDSLQSVFITIDDPSGSLRLVRQTVGTQQSAQQFVLWFSGGRAGTEPVVNFVATTLNGRVIDRDFKLPIRDI